MRASKLLSCFTLANLAYRKARSEDRVNDPRLPARSGPSYCRDARRRAAIFLILTLHRLESSCELSGHAAQPSRITSANHQTVFKPPFMTASAPPLPLMIVNSVTRWLPEPETFGSKSGRVCRPKAQTGHQPHSFGGRSNVERALRKSRVIGRLKLLKNFHNWMVGLGRLVFLLLPYLS